MGDITKAIYNIQDLVFTDISTFELFYEKTFKHFEAIWKKLHKKNKVPKDEFKPLYTFIEVTKQHPQSPALFQALTPLFKMLINDVILQTCMKVYHEKFNKYYYVNYDKIYVAFKRKNILLRKNNLFVIPYIKRIPNHELIQIMWMIGQELLQKNKNPESVVQIAYKQIVSRYGRFCNLRDLISQIVNNN